MPKRTACPVLSYHLMKVTWSSSWCLPLIYPLLYTGSGSYCNCIIHHIKFCPVSLRLISCKALGSLDTSSGGTIVVLDDGFVGREIRFPLTLRWNGFELNGWVFGLTSEEGIPDSSIMVYSGKRKEKPIWKINYFGTKVCSAISIPQYLYLKKFIRFYAIVFQTTKSR